MHQPSSGAWHAFDVDVKSTDGQEISVTIDLSGVLATADDLTRVQVRFLVATPKKAKAEVDSASLEVALGESPTDPLPVDPSDAYEAVNSVPVWDVGNVGAGVGVAIVDTGVYRYHELEKNIQGSDPFGLVSGWSALTGLDAGDEDWNGHGTIVASVISNAKPSTEGRYYGVAPDSMIVPVQVLDEHGQGSYSQVIDGIGWVIANKDAYNIRVMNLSLSALVQSYYWDDPLNQAVMRAWEAGIVVVVAAGNGGPNPMTVGVPGNVPYVITAGALCDDHTVGDWSDDYIPSFSAAGPTYEAFVKPDIVAPGCHVVGLMPSNGQLALDFPDAQVGPDYYQMSGTSMSAAQVSGVVALMLAENPSLTPDELKYALMASSRQAVAEDGSLAVSLWQQGAGRVDAYQATYGAYVGMANGGLNVTADLAGEEHYTGLTKWDPETQEFYLESPDGHIWDGYVWDGGFAWSEVYVDGEPIDAWKTSASLVTWVPDE